MKVACLILSSLAAASAFTVPMSTSHRALVDSRSQAPLVSLMMSAESEESNKEFPAAPALTAAIWALTSTSAMAAGPDWGIFEGKTLSLLHPTMMIGMLALSGSTALLGFAWRRQRTIGDDISALKKTLPDLGGASTIAGAVAAAEAAEQKDSANIARLLQAAPIEAEITALQTERKELSAQGNRDQHFAQGSFMAFVGTCFAIEVRDPKFPRFCFVIQKSLSNNLFQYSRVP
jgi:hypothetical protein